ncbi:MAG: ribulose-phosphate 3-epimerase [Spirochaetaceae bacterium]|nr:MAG: ribulose-phosphate 3-epimerase [Spirochaetaceae bacterium]
MHQPERAFTVAPSLMCADLLNLGSELSTFEQAGMELLHMDIMDGHYVPNMTLSPDVCTQVAAACAIPQDIHLMVENVDRFVPLFSAAAPRYMTFHPETTRHPLRTMQQIRAGGIRPGIAIDPAVSLATVEPLLLEADIVCVMTVSPGYSGQALIPWSLDKIADLAQLRAQRGLDFLIEADGNASWDNIPPMVDAGADIIVAGTSSLFDATMSRSDALTRLQRLARRE